MEYKAMKDLGNWIGMGIGSTSIALGLYLQCLDKFYSVNNHQFLAGHLGDYGAPLAMTCWLNYMNSDYEHTSFLEQAVLTAFVAAYWTGFELLQKGGINPGTYDPMDITAYWLGSATALAISKACDLIYELK